MTLASYKNKVKTLRTTLIVFSLTYLVNTPTKKDDIKIGDLN